MKRAFKIVFDEMEDAVRRSPNPVIAKLSFGLTFQADGAEQAEDIAIEAMRGLSLGRWHVEEEAPTAAPTDTGPLG